MRRYDEGYFDITLAYAKHFSKCQFTKVGAIAVNERNRVVATAVNGTLPNHVNCCDVEFVERDDHVPFTRENEIHAELNLILELIKTKAVFTELTIYLTISPCEECLKILLGLDCVKRIVYLEKYHRTSDESLQKMVDKCIMSGTLLEQHKK